MFGHLISSIDPRMKPVYSHHMSVVCNFWLQDPPLPSPPLLPSPSLHVFSSPFPFPTLPSSPPLLPFSFLSSLFLPSLGPLSSSQLFCFFTPHHFPFFIGHWLYLVIPQQSKPASYFAILCICISWKDSCTSVNTGSSSFQGSRYLPQDQVGSQFPPVHGCVLSFLRLAQAIALLHGSLFSPFCFLYMQLLMR